MVCGVGVGNFTIFIPEIRVPQPTKIMNKPTVNRYPMVAAAVFFMAGIALFDSVVVPWWVMWGGELFCLVLAAVMIRQRVANLYIAAALFLFGGAILTMRGFSPQITPNERAFLTLEVEDNAVIRKGFVVMPARIVEYEQGDGVRHSSERVNLLLDTLVSADFGSRIEALGRILPFPEKMGEYGRLMLHRGFSGTLFLRADDVVKVENNQEKNLHTIAIERLSRLKLSGDEAAIVGAMAVGDRRGMTPELREAYARAGASHILAVSGLHVGIVFLLFNILLRWLPLLRHGQVIRAVAVVVPIWIYAAMCGFSPSVVRAAVMFSALQLSVAASSIYLSLNTLAFTAFAMLLYRPDYLFDCSFQLSFIAVFAIVLWGVPLMRSLRTERRWLNAIMATMVVGMVSSLATMPLVAHTFGTVSLVGIVLNPLVILCAYLVVILSVVWIALPFAPLAGLVGFALDAVVKSLNFVIEMVAGWEWSAVEISLPTWAVWIIYAIAVAITALLGYAETKKSVNLPYDNS